MTNSDTCPSCKSDLRAEEIPEEHRYLYGNHTHFSRRIAYEIQGVYDGALLWLCPDCGHFWPRFTDGRLERLGVCHATLMNTRNGSTLND